MKISDDILQRLLHTASLATPEPELPPLGLEGRIIASWHDRAGRERLDPFAIVRPVLLGAVALACVAGAMEYRTFTADADPATFVTDSAFLTALNR